MRRLRQECWVVRHGGIATLRLDDLGQLPEGGTGGDRAVSRARAASRLRSRPAATSASAPSARVTSIRSAGPSPRSARTPPPPPARCRTRGRAAGPWRSPAPRSGTPLASPRSIIVRASSRALRLVGHERPAPRLHVEDQRSSSPSASFFDMMLAAISGIEGTVPVTSRSAYSLPVRRSDLRRLAEHRAPESARTWAPRPRRARAAVRKPGNRLELVEGAAGVAEAPARHHRHGDAAAGEHRGEQERGLVPDSRRWSACPPAARPSRRIGAARRRPAWRR